MPLYSLDEVQQPPIGRQQHWNLFLAFQGLSAPCCDSRRVASPISTRRLWIRPSLGAKCWQRSKRESLWCYRHVTKKKREASSG